MKHSPFDGCFVFITKIYFEPTTDGFPEQHTRPPPVAQEGENGWHSGRVQICNQNGCIDFL